MAEVHAVPTNDLMEHEISLQCVCGPDTTNVAEGNPILPAGTFHKHHALRQEHVRWRTYQRGR